ncbi:MAG: pyruvate:ferredoxin (flavodoxin) oxidoreductase [Myxococcota bacterium]|jgi:pyruvate-ferredoxin/flavodoxin oxidoreductase|nr:pyruvate:ferredoxin (flavodoxin) oxidoreductase [Myxococcota bacterium]
MAEQKWMSMDGNAATTHSAHAMSEVVCIYPITPSSPMAEMADEASAKGKKNIFGQVPKVYEMQSEAGAAGAVHGAAVGGCLTSTFTASQGLLLMIPNMYKMAGELMPGVIHVSARTLSTHALSIFGDHSDVMLCRSTGYAMAASNDPQEAMDLAAIATATSLRAKLPFIHFFDGFRTSHEIQKVSVLPLETMRALVDDADVAELRRRAINPDRPTMRGTAMNPDIWFQGAEARNPYYAKVPDLFSAVAEQFAELTGRRYAAFQYVGDPAAETVLVLMGSGANVAQEAVQFLHAHHGRKAGVLKVRLYRPFDAARFFAALPRTAKRLVVLDRTKEPGAVGEPLYQDVVAAFDQLVRQGQLAASDRPLVIGGRYGLSSKEFTPRHVRTVLDHVEQNAPAAWIHGFTVGIEDDVSGLSLPLSPDFDPEDPSVRRAKFFGLGSDGTVGANKNSIKIIGDYQPEASPLAAAAAHGGKWVQAYFVYDSKKAGGTTVSHLRFSDQPILSSYVITKPDFVAIHNKEFLGKYDLLDGIQEGGTVLINTDLPRDEIFASFPRQDQETLIAKKIKLFAIDAFKVAGALGLGGRINTTMQAAFFKVAQILPDEVYFKAIQAAVAKTYGKKGARIVELNIEAFRKGMDEVFEVPVPAAPASDRPLAPALQPLPGEEGLGPILNGVIEPIMRLQGDSIPVSRVPVDGVFPTGTTKYEKRSTATHVPNWSPDLCIQCGYCSFSCPHAAIRGKVSLESEIQLGADLYPTIPLKGKGAQEGDRYRIQVFADDCTGCGVCAKFCLGSDKKTGHKALEMVPKYSVLETLRQSEQEYLRLPPTPARLTDKSTVKGVSLTDGLFEFSGACPGCGETPYIKLVTQLVGDRMIQANATGCSSIYGGTAPTCPYAKNAQGKGPAWASSLFEDAAEFGLGMRLAVDQLAERAAVLREQLLAKASTRPELQAALAQIAPVPAQRQDEAVYLTSKAAEEEVRRLLAGSEDAAERELNELASYLTDKVVWSVGGDGWAYDIGYGGLDHVVASDKDLKILVLDTEVYSNTGGQRSKATFIGGVAKFASAGKEVHKKDLGLMCMSYRTAYVASINFGANPLQALRALREAISYPGPAIVIAYSNCIEHGVPMEEGPEAAKLAQDCGYWLTYRFDPRRLLTRENPLVLDTKKVTKSVSEYLNYQRRFKRLADERPDVAQRLFAEAETFVANRFAQYQKLAAMSFEDWKLTEG